MEHTEAIEKNASDRYVLGQLSAAEADAFEEHYFDCSACAEDVRLGMSIMDGGRRLVQEEANAPAAPTVAPVVPIDSRGRWGRWIPAAAVAAVMAIPINFALLMRMQSVVPRAGVVVVEATFRGSTRTAAQEPLQVLRIPTGMSALLEVEVPPPAAPHARYEARVLGGDDRVETYPLTSELIQDRLKIPLPDPGPGMYDLAIVGIDPAGETEIVRHSFRVKR